MRIDVADASTDAEVVSPEPPPSRPRIRGADIAGAIACCALVLIAFAPVVFGGRTLSAAGKGAAGVTGTAPFPGQPPADYSPDFRPDQGASTWAFEPWARVNEQTYSEGELPFWNPYQGAGTPQAANMQSAPFDPLLLAVNLHPTQRVWDFSIVGAFVLGALATFVFARVLGLFTVPAVVASAAYSLSGFFFLYSNNQFSRSYAYLPILLLLIEMTLRSRRSWPVFTLAIAVAGNFVVGMPEASLFVLGAAVVYGIARIVQQRHEVPPTLAIARVGGGFLLGVVVASPLLLSFHQYEALSFNTHKGSSGQGSQADPTWGLLNLGRTVLPWGQEGVHESGRSRLVRRRDRCCRAPRRVRSSRDAPGTCVAVLRRIPPAPREDLRLPCARLGGRAPYLAAGELSRCLRLLSRCSASPSWPG